MDYGTYRGIYTLILLVLFLGIVYFAYSKNRKDDFEDIGASILDDEDIKKDVNSEIDNSPRKKESSNDND